VRERYKLDVNFDEGYSKVRPLSSHDRTFHCYVINLAIMVSLLSIFSKFRLEPPVMACLVLKFGKLVA
jgi:hypothetical protein